MRTGYWCAWNRSASIARTSTSALCWGVSESTVCRIVHWVENRLMQGGQFRLPGLKQLVRGFGKPEVVVMDVTETPIERPKRRQRSFYSGKKKRHTLKAQIVIEHATGQIICTFFGHWSTTRFSCCIKLTGFALHLRHTACTIRAIRASKSYMPTANCPTRSPEAGNSTEHKRQIIGHLPVIE